MLTPEPSNVTIPPDKQARNILISFTMPYKQPKHASFLVGATIFQYSLSFVFNDLACFPGWHGGCNVPCVRERRSRRGVRP